MEGRCAAYTDILIPIGGSSDVVLNIWQNIQIRLLFGLVKKAQSN